MAKIQAILMTICIVVSVAAVAPTASAASSDPLPSDQVFSASDGVNVWERGLLPLRADTSNAEESIGISNNPTVFVNLSDKSGDTTTNKQLAVYEPDTTISFTFTESAATDTTELSSSNTEVQFIAARVTGSDKGIPNTFSDAIDLISGDNINQNATFEVVNSNKQIDTNGPKPFSYTPSQPGHYVVFVVSDNSGGDAVSETNGEISINEDITVLGTDAVSVQRTPSNDITQETSNPEPGDDITFNVDATDQLGSSGVSHMLAVYNQDQLSSSVHTINVDSSEIDSDFDIQNNSTFDHSIASVDGVADIESGASINGISLSDGRVSRSVGFGAMIDFIAEDLGGTAPTTNRNGNTVLNASIDADVNTDGDHTLTVETNDSWEEDTYQYVYVATLEDNKSAITTDIGTLVIDTPTAGGGGGGGGGGGDDSTDGDRIEDVELPEEVQNDIDDLGAEPTSIETKTVTVDPGSGTSTVSFDQSVNVESAVLTTTDESTEVTVTDLDPDTVTNNPAPGQSITLADISVSESGGDGSSTEATVRFRVSNERLEERGTAAENLRVFRLNSGSWEGLQTSVAEETANGVVVEAETPGFSVFAVSSVTPPEASISLDPATAQVGEDVTLSGVDSSDEDGEIVSYEWSVDGETLSGDTVSTSLDAAGDYTVELTVTDDSGETDTVTETLTITQADTATPTPEPATDTSTPAPGTEATTTDTGTPGFGILVAVIALLGAAAMIGRQRTDD